MGLLLLLLSTSSFGSSSSSNANLTLRVAATGGPIEPGIQLLCFGPYLPPSGARSLRHLLPEVNMDIVHHMIMFGGRGSVRSGSSQACNSGAIMYAWARTGQTTPIGLDFEDAKAAGDVGFAVGPGTSYEWIALQIHYQQLGSEPIADTSGVKLTFGEVAPHKPLDVALMASWRVRIPPKVKMDECVACRVRTGGVAVAWRNHAHRLARDIYSEHFDRAGVALGSVGLISAQQPQIFRVLEKPLSFSVGDLLLLHCQYDSTDVRAGTVTYLGVDERTHEMCNQYLMATAGMRLSCGEETMQRDAKVTEAFAVGASKLEAPHLGQVTGLALDEQSGTLYAFHRAGNTYFSTSKIVQPSIAAFSLKGQLLRTLARDTFYVPHGLSLDHRRMLWATDVSTHRVYRIDPNTDAVTLTLGDGRAAQRDT